MEMHQGQCREILVAAGFDPKRIETVLYDRKRGVARDIIAEARKGCDAVVIRRRGTTQIVNLVMGSVAEKLFAAVDFVPLLFAGLKPQNDRLLVAYDGSEAANRARHSQSRERAYANPLRDSSKSRVSRAVFRWQGLLPTAASRTRLRKSRWAPCLPGRSVAGTPG